MSDHYSNDKDLMKSLNSGRVNLDKGATDFVQTEEGTYRVTDGVVVDKMPVSEQDRRKRRYERENEGK